MTREEHPDDRDRVVGWDGATLDDQVVDAMAELERVRVESRPASVFDIFDFGSSPPPNVVLPLREVLGGAGEDDPDPDPYGLWALLDGLRAQPLGSSSTRTSSGQRFLRSLRGSSWVR